MKVAILASIAVIAIALPGHGRAAAAETNSVETEVLRTLQMTCFENQQDFSRVAKIAQTLDWQESLQMAETFANEPSRAWVFSSPRTGKIVVLAGKLACHVYAHDVSGTAIEQAALRLIPSLRKVTSESRGLLTRVAYQISTDAGFPGLLVLEFERGSRGCMTSFIPDRARAALVK